jgi:HEAT repeat protein
MLRIYFGSRPNIARLLADFAPVCDRLAALAKKSREGGPLTDDDDKWIQDYGVTLAGFSFYYGNSYEVPRDDFPIVTRVFSNPAGDSMLYAGLARPQALYIVIPVGKTLQLYRGAVMTYREFVRPNDKLLDDESWRDLISKGQTPPAPPFTKSFYAETSVTELLQQLRAQSSRDNPNYGDTRDLLWQINARATAADLPQLLEFLTHTKADENGEAADELASIIARLPWKSHEKEMVKLLASDDHTLANAAARMLMEQPARLDTGALASNFATQPVRARRLYCALLSKLPQQTDATRRVFLQALHDKADGVRWQAALAIGNSGWDDDQSRATLVKTVDDTNELVGAAAVHALVKLGVTNAAPVLLEKLKVRVLLPVSTSEERSPEAKAILQDIQGEENHATGVLDNDHLSYRIEMTVTPTMLRRKTMRVPPMPLPMDMSLHNYNIADELIDALGDFAYSPATDELIKLHGTEYDLGATRALGKIAPDQLAAGLLKTALNKNIDSYLREQALVTLADVSSTNHVRDLVPLLDDTTPIEYSRPMPGNEWRVCDRTAETMAMLLGWEDNRMRRPFSPPAEREKILARAREWAKANSDTK